MNELKLTAQIEGLLFYYGKPVKKSELAIIFGLEDEALSIAIAELHEELYGRGFTLLEDEESLELATNPKLDPLIDTLRSDEVTREIGKAGAETLAIVLYRGPVSRAEIEQIRGVNCQHILRNLLIRDLITRDSTKKVLIIFLQLDFFHILVSRKKKIYQILPTQ